MKWFILQLTNQLVTFMKVGHSLFTSRCYWISENIHECIYMNVHVYRWDVVTYKILPPARDSSQGSLSVNPFMLGAPTTWHPLQCVLVWQLAYRDVSDDCKSMTMFTVSTRTMCSGNPIPHQIMLLLMALI